MSDNGTHDETVTLTSAELTAVSDVLRRQQPGNHFTGKPEFQSALVKLEIAKWHSYDNDYDPDLDDETAHDIREAFPVDEGIAVDAEEFSDVTA